MSSLSQYLIKIVCVAAISSVLYHLFSPQSIFHKLVMMISGLYMAFTIISPILNVKFNLNMFSLDDFYQMADVYCENGDQMAISQNNEIIKIMTESYVLEKARSLNADLTVDVSVDNNGNRVFQSITLKGNISPYAKELLSETMECDLGISREDQIWIN